MLFWGYGAYAFPSASALRIAVESQVNLNTKEAARCGADTLSPKSVNAEVSAADYHCSTVITLMMQDDKTKFLGIEVPAEQFSSVGTPEELPSLSTYGVARRDRSCPKHIERTS